MTEKKKSYLEKYQDFLKDKDFLDEKTFNTINRILEGIIDIFDETSIDKKEIGEIKQNLDLLKVVIDKKELLSDIFVLCLDAYEKGNKKRIKSLIEAYKYNPVVSLKEYFKLENNIDELDLLDRIETIIEKGNYDSDNMIVGYYNSYGRPTKEVIDYLVASGINVDDYKDYHYFQEIERKYREILKAKEDGTPGIDFISMLNELELTVNEYEDLKEKREDEKKKEEIIIDGFDPSDPYNNSDCNYLIFFDKEQYLQREQELLRKHPDVITKGSFQRKWNKLINTKIETLMTDNISRNIVVTKMKPNIYNVRELRRGSIRVGFKVIDNAEIDGHKVIAVLLPSYGKTDGNVKKWGLLSSLGMYENNIYVAEQLGKICSNNATEEEKKEALGMIEEFKEYYKGFDKDISKEK